MKKQTHCSFCGRYFCPDPRQGERQKACGNPDCRKKRKQEAHRRWVQANPGCFKGRYVNVKVWREAHPGYQRAWRARIRASLPKSGEIQDTIRPETPVKSIRLWYRPGFRVRYKTRSGWEAAIDATPR